MKQTRFSLLRITVNKKNHNKTPNVTATTATVAESWANQSRAAMNAARNSVIETSIQYSLHGTHHLAFARRHVKRTADTSGEKKLSNSFSLKVLSNYRK